MRMLDKEEEEANDAAEVTWEDQQRINSFSKLNTRVRSIQDKLERLKQEQDALDDLEMELQFVNEEEPIRYKIGEIFVNITHVQTLKYLASYKADVDSRITKHETLADDCEVQMKQLKVLLYAKFGGAINLDE